MTKKNKILIDVQKVCRNQEQKVNKRLAKNQNESEVVQKQVDRGLDVQLTKMANQTVTMMKTNNQK